jgi:hypothetical protein
MNLDELLPALHDLPRLDKFRPGQFLTAELAQAEAGLTPGAEYPIWSPYEAHDAAATLTNFLTEQKECTQKYAGAFPLPRGQLGAWRCFPYAMLPLELRLREGEAVLTQGLLDSGATR